MIISIYSIQIPWLSPSIFTDTPLPSELVHDKEMGLMKLEAKYSFYCSIGPKTWIGVTDSGEKTCKIKGYKYSLEYLQFLNLLQANSMINLSQNKWHKDFEMSAIIMKDTTYILKSTDNKRLAVFCNGVLIFTRNFILINGVLWTLSSNY